ncbi:alpha/beta hydrolase [Nocardioides endophyticus]|uniref:Alpha/beta hydrolase n=1 Tax=Nocardioides endophyticus TaxID=1353775 RepID=A0ABP8Z1E0_9ACTN
MPAWYRDALALVPAYDAVTAAGARVAYRAWGPVGAPGVVLVHGSAAHGGWWDHVAPHLDRTRRVVAIDLSGHGASDHRPAYALEVWAHEVAAVADAAGARGPIVLVGHSMGAFVTLRAAEVPRAEVAGVLAIDPPVREIDSEVRAARAALAAAVPPVYATAADAAARWRPRPAQHVLPYVRDHIAAESVGPVDGGWSWRFDPRAFDRPDVEPEDWGPIECDVTVLRAEHGMLSSAMADHLVDRLGPRARRLDVHGAGHHVMLDRPLAVASAAQDLLARVDRA